MKMKIAVVYFNVPTSYSSFSSLYRQLKVFYSKYVVIMKSQENLIPPVLPIYYTHRAIKTETAVLRVSS